MMGRGNEGVRTLTEETEFTNGGTEFTEDERRRAVRRRRDATHTGLLRRPAVEPLSIADRLHDKVANAILLRSSSVLSVAPFVNSVSSVFSVSSTAQYDETCNGR